MNSNSMNRDRPPRWGFTVVELLVSIGIIGLLAALSLPAVQSSREASRKTQCRSHLKQIILATSNYEATWKIVPGQSWQKAIAPYLEQKEDTTDPSNLYACPSDPLSVQRELPSDRSYRICDGTKPDYPGSGYLMGSSGASLANITDGLSQTCAFGERLVTPPGNAMILSAMSNPNSPILKRLFRQIAINPSSDEQFVDECQNHPLAPLLVDFAHVGYHHLLPPNGNTCLYGVITGGEPDPFSNGPETASSLHPSGVHVAMADGSVRFFSDSIELALWRALGTRARGDVISGDF